MTQDLMKEIKTLYKQNKGVITAIVMGHFLSKGIKAIIYLISAWVFFKMFGVIHWKGGVTIYHHLAGAMVGIYIAKEITSN